MPFHVSRTIFKSYFVQSTYLNKEIKSYIAYLFTEACILRDKEGTDKQMDELADKPWYIPAQ